jgi:hypothetical protein
LEYVIISYIENAKLLHFKTDFILANLLEFHFKHNKIGFNRLDDRETAQIYVYIIITIIIVRKNLHTSYWSINYYEDIFLVLGNNTSWKYCRIIVAHLNAISYTIYETQYINKRYIYMHLVLDMVYMSSDTFQMSGSRCAFNNILMALQTFCVLRYSILLK